MSILKSLLPCRFVSTLGQRRSKLMEVCDGIPLLVLQFERLNHKSVVYVVNDLRAIKICLNKVLKRFRVINWAIQTWWQEVKSFWKESTVPQAGHADLTQKLFCPRPFCFDIPVKKNDRIRFGVFSAVLAFCFIQTTILINIANICICLGKW